MATSSITHNFVISNPNSVKLFIAAIDEADRDRTPKQTLPEKLEKYYQIPFKLKKYPLRNSEIPIVLEDFLYNYTIDREVRQ